MIKCSASSRRRCFVLQAALENPLPPSKRQPRGVILTPIDGVVVYRMKVKGGAGWVDYVMPYCPWCGARLRGAEKAKAVTT